MSEDFQMLQDDDNPHPIIKALKDGGKLESIKIGAEWSDDHCPCMNVTATVGGTDYKYSDWWLSKEGLKMYYQAEVSLEKLEEVKKHILQF